MGLVHSLGGGSLEIAWTKLPWFVAVDQALQTRVRETLAKEFVGKPITNETLYNMTLRLSELIMEAYPMKGLQEVVLAAERME